MGEKVIPEDIVLWFSTMRNKMAVSKFVFIDFGKNERGRGPRCPPIFCSLKKGTRNFHIRYNDSSCEILGPLGRYDDPWEKNK